jgi:hypothetical protein
MISFVTIVVFVPLTHADKVRKAMGGAGAGLWGNYSQTSFSSKGIGRFFPLEGAKPAIGKVGKLEEVEEERIEMICSKESIKKVVDEIKRAHPYEEVAYNIYPLVDENNL